MKTLKQVNAARKAVNNAAMTPDLSDVQLALFMGMSNALVWTADAQGMSTLQRLIDGEPIAGGQSTADALERFRKAIETLRTRNCGP